MSGLTSDDPRSALGVHRALEAATVAWHDSHRGLRELIFGLGAVLGCPAGSVWAFDAASQSLVCRDAAAAPQTAAEGVEALVGRAVLVAAESPPARAWTAQAPVAGPMPVESAPELPAALAFPVVGAREPILVIALHAPAPLELGPDLAASLASVGRALGSFIERRHDPVGAPLLTAREVDVLQLAADGLTGPAIADELVLSRLTVKSHFAHIYRKLGTTDRANAVASAMRMGLIR